MTGAADRVYAHLGKWAPLYVWLLVVLIALGRTFYLSVNVSNSLPGKLFLVHKGAMPQLGDMAAFRHAGGGGYEAGALFLKRVVGVSGSIVTAKDAGAGFRDYFVDGRFVGRAKPVSRSGEPLKPGPDGAIPPGHYYMAADHPDSFDSRYAAVGWVAQRQIVGKAYRIF
ncbi:MAG: S26 family signal peptidase [Tepidimonas ignava]|uniref:S26 family signal peptidase n=1 Tax=Tepidimonas ignava TaxID=114249 RepID=UPI003918EDAC